MKAGTTPFTVNVVLPVGVPSGEITDLKLFATAPVQPNVLVRSRDVDLTLVVQPSGK